MLALSLQASLVCVLLPSSARSFGSHFSRPLLRGPLQQQPKRTAFARVRLMSMAYLLAPLFSATSTTAYLLAPRLALLVVRLPSSLFFCLLLVNDTPCPCHLFSRCFCRRPLCSGCRGGGGSQSSSSGICKSGTAQSACGSQGTHGQVVQVEEAAGRRFPGIWEQACVRKEVVVRAR